MSKPFEIHPVLQADFYKVGHPFQYPNGLQAVQSNWTARKSRLDGVHKMVMFGLQAFVMDYLIDQYNRNFFNLKWDDAIAPVKRRLKNSIGGIPSYDHLEALHKLGYAPLQINALPEGSLVPMRVPCFTLESTHDQFGWFTNSIETILSTSVWLPITSATIAHEYRKILDTWAEHTGMPAEFVQWQGHDFSMRGMSSLQSAWLSGMGHLLSFTGTDTIPAIDAAEHFYGANSDTELVGGSVAATEHSVMCAGGVDNELETYRRLITEVYPDGIVSIVSDTWNLWDVCTVILPKLKKEIMARNGKVVIRPDSGNPVDIMIGDPNAADPRARKGVIRLLWEVFGGTENDKGFKVLDPHIGAIYGDSITREYANDICMGLAAQGFASQAVFGIGSFTYQFNTRDTFGHAIKATWAKVNGEGRDLFKNPVTDSGMKKSAKGRVAVAYDEDGGYQLIDGATPEIEAMSLLEPVFKDGQLLRRHTFAEIRERLARARARGD